LTLGGKPFSSASSIVVVFCKYLETFIIERADGGRIVRFVDHQKDELSEGGKMENPFIV
jgi:hypothetical protein